MSSAGERLVAIASSLVLVFAADVAAAQESTPVSSGSASSTIAVELPRELEETLSTPQGVLVSYSFDSDDLATGPDTFAVFEHSKGTVNLSSHFRLSGYNAIEIRDVPRDRDFPELQGYFPTRDSGTLWAHFALLLTDPSEELNIALAGPRWFNLGKDGIAFWLTTRDGQLVHISDSIPKRLFRPTPFVWYHVDLTIDLAAGVYDLWIEEEGSEQPIVALERQPNAASQPHSAIDKFSFIGDRGQDTSAVVYYVDDVILAVGEPVQLEPFVAPGRRRFFVDALDDLRDGGVGPCLPAIGPADFGVTRQLTERLRSQGEGTALRSLLSEAATPEHFELEEVAALVRAKQAWRSGCEQLARDETESAVESLAAAVDTVDTVEGSHLYEAAWVLALAQAQAWSEVDEWLSWLDGEWSDDPRFVVLLARVAEARGDSKSVESRLAEEAYAILQEPPTPALSGLVAHARPRPIRPTAEASPQTEAHRSLRHSLVPLEYFALLLWQGRFGDARHFALTVASHLREADLDDRKWLERAADAAFHEGDFDGAGALYRDLLTEEGAGPAHVLLKLSDVHFRQGDLEGERAYREAIYGRLDFE